MTSSPPEDGKPIVAEVRSTTSSPARTPSATVSPSAVGSGVGVSSISGGRPSEVALLISGGVPPPPVAPRRERNSNVKYTMTQDESGFVLPPPTAPDAVPVAEDSLRTYTADGVECRLFSLDKILPTAGALAFMRRFNKEKGRLKEAVMLCRDHNGRYAWPQREQDARGDVLDASEGCKMGLSCLEVHLKDPRNTVPALITRVHRLDVSDTAYARLRRGVTLRVTKPNVSGEPVELDSGDVFSTYGVAKFIDDGADGCGYKLQHCAHYTSAGLCLLGSSCRFVHCIPSLVKTLPASGSPPPLSAAGVAAGGGGTGAGGGMVPTLHSMSSLHSLHSNPLLFGGSHIHHPLLQAGDRADDVDVRSVQSDEEEVLPAATKHHHPSVAGMNPSAARSPPLGTRGGSSSSSTRYTQSRSPHPSASQTPQSSFFPVRIGPGGGEQQHLQQWHSSPSLYPRGPGGPSGGPYGGSFQGGPAPPPPPPRTYHSQQLLYPASSAAGGALYPTFGTSFTPPPPPPPSHHHHQQHMVSSSSPPLLSDQQQQHVLQDPSSYTAYTVGGQQFVTQQQPSTTYHQVPAAQQGGLVYIVSSSPQQQPIYCYQPSTAIADQQQQPQYVVIQSAAPAPTGGGMQFHSAAQPAGGSQVVWMVAQS